MLDKKHYNRIIVQSGVTVAQGILLKTGCSKRNFRVELLKFGEGLTANTEPSLVIGRCRDLTGST